MPPTTARSSAPGEHDEPALARSATERKQQRRDQGGSVSRRADKKERRRREREACQRAAREAERRRLWIRYATAGMLAVALLTVVVAAIVTGDGGRSESTETSHGSSSLQTGAPPWPPETSRLQTRLAGLDLPSEGESHHAHAVLRIFVDGEQSTCPRTSVSTRQAGPWPRFTPTTTRARSTWRPLSGTPSRSVTSSMSEESSSADSSWGA